MTPEDERRAVGHAEIVLVCIYVASVISGLGGVWCLMGETLMGAR